MKTLTRFANLALALALYCLFNFWITTDPAWLTCCAAWLILNDTSKLTDK